MNSQEWSDRYYEHHSKGIDVCYGLFTFLYAWFLMLACGAVGLGIVGYWPAVAFIIVARYVISAAGSTSSDA